MKQLFKLMTAALLLCGSNAAFAGEHAHFAAFFDGTGKAAFPATVNGDDIEGPLRKTGAEMMIFAHSAGVKDGDVWTLQNDTLRDVNGDLVDLGIGCQLTMKVKPAFAVQGLCSVFMNGHEGAGQEKSKNIVNDKTVNELLVWHKIFEDKDHGIAGYFMRETAADFDHH